MVFPELFVSLHCTNYDVIMDKKIEVSGLERSDKGGVHKKYRHGGVRIGMYNFNGELEAEYADIDVAVAENPVGATYRGIVDCVTGKTKKHAGKIWRKEGAQV